MAEEEKDKKYFSQRYQRLLMEYRDAGLRDYHLLNDYFKAGGKLEELEKLARERIKEFNMGIIEVKRKKWEEYYLDMGAQSEKKDLNTQQNNLKNGEAETNH